MCTGVDATPGTLERALIRDSNSMFKIYCRNHNIPIRSCGSLVCSWPWDSHGNDDETVMDAQLNTVYQESFDANDIHITKLSPSQVLTQYERNISQSIQGAIHIPGEIVVDSWLYSISLAIHGVSTSPQYYCIFSNFNEHRFMPYHVL